MSETNNKPEEQKTMQTTKPAQTQQAQESTKAYKETKPTEFKEEAKVRAGDLPAWIMLQGVITSFHSEGVLYDPSKENDHTAEVPVVKDGHFAKFERVEFFQRQVRKKSSVQVPLSELYHMQRVVNGLIKECEDKGLDLTPEDYTKVANNDVKTV